MAYIARLLFAAIFLCVMQGAYAQDPFSEPLETIRVLRAEHVVSLRFLGNGRSGGQEDKTVFELELRTRAGVRLYAKNMRFVFSEAAGIDRILSFTGQPAAVKQYDNWYKEEREFFVPGTIFRLTDGMPLAEGGELRLKFEACNVKMCLMPATYVFAPLKPGALGVPELGNGFDIKETPGPTKGTEPSTHPTLIAEPVETVPAAFTATVRTTPAPQPVAGTATPEASRVSESSLVDFNHFLQKQMRSGGWLLLPLLFLAGLAVNLTPCVYPMIPITMSVLGRFGKANSGEKHWSKRLFLPSIYVLGVALAYSLMGVVAGMTGGLFGSLLQSPAVSLGIAVLMFLLGLMMLGVFDLSRLQSLGSRIPLSNKSPAAAVFVMGGVSGLVSAPCTGPVLASLLLLVGQTRDPLQGFSLLFVFALGFGSPYIVLGTVSQKVARLPRLGFAEELVKFCFAALMFALAFYYSRMMLGRLGMGWLFARPHVAGVVATATLLLIVGALLPRLARAQARSDSGRATFLWRGGATIFVAAATVAALWLTLWALKAFPTRATQIHWVKSWDEAMQVAQSEHRAVVVDLWADWCAACKEMDATTWLDPDVVAEIERDFVAVKIDFTEENNVTAWFTKTWELGGLPAVGFFRAGDDLQGKPRILFRQKVEESDFLKAAESILKE